MNKQIIQFLLASLLVIVLLSLVIIYFDSKYIVVPIIAILCVGLVTIIYFYLDNNVEKEYYKNIVNTSTNIIVETNGTKLHHANKRFFDYVTVNSLQEYINTYNSCVSAAFVLEDGYLQKKMGELSWLDYLCQNSAGYHKVKVFLNDKFYYFSVSATISIRDKKNYNVIFSDITEQEHYKINLEILTVKDALTNIGNRRVFETKLYDAIVISQRYQYPFSLIVFDIDFFKKVNDKHGHDIGDKVLIEYTKLIGASLREGDEFCRIGGEEFVIIVPHTTKDKAYSIAQKIRVMVENHKEILPITMSFGVTQYIKGDDDTTLYKRADEALYKAKESGRNKVMLG